MKRVRAKPVRLVVVVAAAVDVAMAAVVAATVVVVVEMAADVAANNNSYPKKRSLRRPPFAVQALLRNFQFRHGCDAGLIRSIFTVQSPVRRLLNIMANDQDAQKKEDQDIQLPPISKETAGAV